MFIPSFRGARAASEPGIHKHRLALWIPDSGLRPAPECPDCVCPEQNECPVVECPEPQECPEPPECPEIDYNDCPTIVITKNVTVHRYVCPNGLVMDNPEECFPDLSTNLTPIKTNENGTLIESVTVEPACIYGLNGGVVQFKVGSIASEIWFQAKEDGEYWNVHYLQNLYEGTKYFVIADKKGNADFSLDKNKVYLFRIQFRIAAYNETQYSNEHLIDTRTGSGYTVKKC